MIGFGRRRKDVSAFSLVEVVLAMGIIAFALIVLFALVPVGLKSNVDSSGESQAVNVLQSLISDRRSSNYTNASSLYGIPALSSVSVQQKGTFYVMEDGSMTNSAQAPDVRYRVDYTVYPASANFACATNYPVSSLPMPVTINFKVSWPAAAANSHSSVETAATFMSP